MSEVENNSMDQEIDKSSAQTENANNATESVQATQIESADNAKESVKTADGAVSFHLDQILQKRLLASFIDLVLVGVGASVLIFIVAFVSPFLGSIFSFFVFLTAGIVILIKDMPFKIGELDSQSPGKKAMNIRVTDLKGGPITLKQSIQRNAIVAMPYAVSALGSLFAMIPIIGVVGTLLIVLPLMLISFAANCYEIYRIYSGERNRRWGDQFAGTIVAWE